MLLLRIFLTQLSRGSISVGLHSQQSICQATLLIGIIHLPYLFHTSRFNQLLNPDRKRYFFMKDASHILRVNVAEIIIRKSRPPAPRPPSPVPQFVEPRVRKLFMLDIAFTTVNPLLFYVTFRLFTVLYFSVRSSRSSASRYGLPS